MFYGPVVNFLQAAAKNLDMEIELLENDNNHMNTAGLVQKSLQSGLRPDAYIAVSVKESGFTLLEIAEDARIPVMIEDGAILDPNVGAPREKFRYYIGEMLPSEEMAGYTLAKYLIAKGKPASDGKIHVLAFNGVYGSSASVGREKGLRRALAENPKAELKQIVSARWEPDLAATMFTGLIKRYPEASVVWSASDGMALGVLKAAKALGLSSGKDFVIGGVDWSAEGVAAVRDGAMQATAGGHFMEAAWALVLVYDYLNGTDFQGQGVRIKTDMTLLTKENYAKYAPLFDPANWEKLNFSRLSKVHNPKMSRYDFSVANVLKLMAPTPKAATAPAK
jgi:ABC-type sugar transport system substrate-binding protein